ncbi:hypothetical protein [Actinokineospora bangkokensis]|uniref:Uncharacterized protein n=1 Tax=Actinokineospora bangkokensis TaxID=1193682 RepID=A0A1Q9LBT5_9PSEU|nr:hypothetical protein [Actinokineospora bangkokensis]OLR89488.1 hypothetical protein BJP25_05220 [Actinokineospora bangkokensis]
MRAPHPLAALLRLVDRFEERGVHTPGLDDDRAPSPWRDHGWLIAAWLVGVALFVLFLAFAG